MPSTAYLGLELKQRELESRLLIAIKLLHEGVNVVFGQQWAIFDDAGRLPKGVILFKTVNDIQARNMERFKSHGHLVTATDEEVLICDTESGFLLAFSDLAGPNCDLFFAQSERHKKAVEKKAPNLRGKVIVAGNARVELLTGNMLHGVTQEALELRNIYGDYMLFNTNYGALNSIWGDINRVANVAVSTGHLNPKVPASIAEFRKVIEWELRNRIEMIRLIKWSASTIKNQKFVIRPHPIEKAEFWEKEFLGYQNIIVVARSNPHPWMIGARLIVHTGCTTGLEAALLGKFAINLMPSDFPVFDIILKHINMTVRTWEEGASMITRYLDNSTLVDSATQHMFAAKLEEHLPKHTRSNASSIISQQISRLAETLPSDERGLNNLAITPYQRTKVQVDKFTLHETELQNALTHTSRLAGVNLKASIKKLADSLFLLSPRP